MMDVTELKTWINTLPPGDVGIDDGGLTLVHFGENGEASGAYMEVGGISEESEGEGT